MRRAKLSRNDRKDAPPLAEIASVRALLADVVDYAGLFPPASLDMMQAVLNYADYLQDPQAWMLGRFVVPWARIDEFAACWSALRADSRFNRWHLAVLLGADPVAEIVKGVAFNIAREARLQIDFVEAKVTDPAVIAAAAAATKGRFQLFVEIALDDDPTPLIKAVAQAGARAKLRTGGTTADAFPPPEMVVRFIRTCVDHGVPFKATAGLHHPLRAEYRLTYAPDAARGWMYGYMNVLLATGLVRQGADDATAVQALTETDPAAISFADACVRWRDRELGTAALASLRRDSLTAFGSCSFTEPVDELRPLLQ